MFICVTHVDNNTGVPGFKAPMRNGPRFPTVKGLDIIWWDQSNWPLTHPDQYPKFYGTCDDDADTSIPGVIKVLTEEEYNSEYEGELYARKPKYCTPRQARLALLKANLLTQVEAAIEALEEPQKTQAKIEWEFASEIYRESDLIKSITAAAGLTSEQVDELFETASQIGVNFSLQDPATPE